MVQLRVQDLSKRFDNRWIFRQLSLELTQGQVLVVAGRNGSGKSTLLKVLAGLLPATDGQVEVMDEAEPRHRIGLSSPEQALYGALSGIENYCFFAKLRGVAMAEDTAKAKLDSVGLEGRGRDRADSYSTGMKQRLRLAVATLHSPPVLLLDEATSGMDGAGRKIIDDILDNQRARGITLFATNDPAEYRFGDRRLELGL